MVIKREQRWIVYRKTAIIKRDIIKRDRIKGDRDNKKITKIDHIKGKIDRVSLKR